MRKTIKWLKANARPLEKALFKYHFEQGDQSHVVYELRKFQNTDGGFGHALEPDFRNPNSNPMDSWVASRILYEIDVDQNAKIVTDLITYLMHTKDQHWMFENVVISNNEYPHAPWWHYDLTLDNYSYNPTASLLGFLYRYMDKKDEKYLEVVSQIHKAIEYFITHEVTEMHELRCFNELYDYILIDLEHDVFRETLRKRNLSVIEKDANLWFSSYCAKPLQVITSKMTPGYEEIKDLVTKEIKLTFNQSAKDGSFDITWSWGQYEEAFEEARFEWKGIIALDLLKNAQRYLETSIDVDSDVKNDG